MTILRVMAPFALLIAFCSSAPAIAAGNSARESNQARASDNQLAPAIREIQRSIRPVYGDVPIPGANVVLHLGRDYYYLSAADARRVIVDAWGNPPTEAGSILGMVFPAGRDFTDADSWGAVITYQADGYVSDSDAASVDYDDILRQIQAGEAENNRARTQAGYPTSNLLGWAQQPTYDANAHSLVWARQYRIAGDTENALNYDVRLLGRHGVLSLNLVTGMSQLEPTRAAAQRLAAAAQFNNGARYADYQAGTDRTAEYGIAGLVAAGAGLSLVKNAGILAAILAFGKKGIVLIIAGLAFLGNWARRFFNRRNEESADSYDYEPPAEDRG